MRTTAFVAAMAAAALTMSATSTAATLPRTGLAVGGEAALAISLWSVRPLDAATAARAPEGRRFWVKDDRFYYSDWYAGRHRKMINFGCTRAPYYDPDPRCADDRGYHHGIDVAMACGTRLFAGFRGRVVHPDSAGALGSAYGRKAFRIRNHRFDKDFVIGHVRRVFVDPGDRVRRGQLIARASDAGAPDGCHLHFEVRPKRAGYAAAVNPRDFIRLHLRH